MEVEKGVAVSHSLFFIVHSSAYAVLSHHTLSNCLSALLCLHQFVYLGVTGRTDAIEGTEVDCVKNIIILNMMLNVIYI